jgi:hypothetical protein
MKLIVMDVSRKHGKEASSIWKEVNQLPSWLKKIMIPIEIWNHPIDVYGSELEKIKKDSPHFNPDLSSGGYVDNKIIIYSNAFKQGVRMKSENPERMSILGLVVHEFGHYLWKDFLLKRVSLEAWNEAREKDGKDKNILSNKFDFVKEYGFYDERTSEEDFAEALRYYVLHEGFLKKECRNRHEVLKLLNN